jgi:3-oxoacyl-[acyl-carrier protein] reductase
MSRLRGKVAIVTGAGSGIGLGTARRFVAEGAKVALVDIDGDAVATAAGELGTGALGVAADVTDAGSIGDAVARATAELGPIDVFHNNAGIAQAVTPVAEVTAGEWARLVAVNMTAFLLGVQAVLPGMRAAGSGCILLTGTIATRRPRSGLNAYVATKAGAVALARQLALELAPDGIRVNVINPGPALTPMLDEFRFGADHDSVVESLSDALPLGRAIEPEDIAAAAVYLASDDARSVTGVILNVDSGRDL